MNINIGEALRFLRQQERLTLQGLGEALGVSTSAICNIEKNRRTPSLHTLHKYGRVFNLEAHHIVKLGEMFSRTKPRASVVLFREEKFRVLERLLHLEWNQSHVKRK